MKNRFLQVISLLAVLCFNSLHADVNWGPGATDVTNDNISIQANVTFAAPIAITINDGQTYTASLSGSARTITGDGDQYPLSIVLSQGSVFKFIVDEDLTFLGAGNPFFMSVSGLGKLIFEVHGDKKLHLGDGNDGAFLYLNMDCNGGPTVEFTRAGDVTKHSEVVIEKSSALGFMAGTKIDSEPCQACEKGTIRFVTGNCDVGRSVLRIKDKGAVIVTGQLYDGSLPYHVSGLDRATPAGREARFEIVNDQGGACAGSLLVINENETYPALLSDPFCENGSQYTGNLYGFVVGANGILNVNKNAYLDYVGTTVNKQPSPKIPYDVLKGKSVSDVVRERNASALIIDGFDNSCACNARIDMDGTSAIYFRSGVDDEGMVSEFNVDGSFNFTINPCNMNACLGNIVLDVEGVLDVTGSQHYPTALNILSLEVVPTGGKVDLDSKKKIFPLRTFARDVDDAYAIYNKADFFINSRMNLYDTVLKHDDRNHKVFEKNCPCPSEPTYLGGEKHLLCVTEQCGGFFDKIFERPRIALYNSRIDFHESAAFSGVDIFVPNLVTCPAQCLVEPMRQWTDFVDVETGKRSPTEKECCPSKDNESFLKFYSNGRCLDNGTGRQLILGTPINCTCTGLFDCDAHLDIIQEYCQKKKTKQILCLETGLNDESIREEIDNLDIQDQPSIHCVFLGCSSNISIGTNNEIGIDPDGLMFNLKTHPTLCVKDLFFSFDSQGGPDCKPEFCATTGKGGIFVDARGKFTTEACLSLATMVVKSHDGEIDLPEDKVFFGCGVGIADWRLDLSEEDRRCFVKPGESFSKYVIDWINVSKDVCDSVTHFEPFNICECDGIEIRNIESIPCVEGTIDQLLVKRSRFGDPLHLKIDGTQSCNANVRELDFAQGCDCAEAPVAVIVLKGNGRVGLGSLDLNCDSNLSTTVLGRKGIILVPDGNGIVDMNDDLLVTDNCVIIPGPNFGIDPETGQAVDQVITFCSTVPREVRVKSGACFDLSRLNEHQIVRFAANAQLTLEAGACIKFSQDTSRTARLQFIEFSQLRFECGDNICPETTFTALRGADKAARARAGEDVTLDRIIPSTATGIGRLEFYDESQAIVTGESEFNIGTFDESPFTSVSFRLFDYSTARIFGNFTIGDVNCSFYNTINGEIYIDGVDAEFRIEPNGFLGFGAVALDHNPILGSSTWTIEPLCNVDTISFVLNEGIFSNNIIESSEKNEVDAEQIAGLFVIGAYNKLNLFMGALQNISILGGGNFMNIGPNVGSVKGVVDTTCGLISGSIASGTQVQVGTIGSLGIVVDMGQIGNFKRSVLPTGFNGTSLVSAEINGLTPAQTFEFFATPDIFTMQFPGANVAQLSFDTGVVNYCCNGTIFRQPARQMTSYNGSPLPISSSFDIGSVDLGINSNCTISLISERIT